MRGTILAIGQRRLAVDVLRVVLCLFGLEFLVRDGLGNDVGQKFEIVYSGYRSGYNRNRISKASHWAMFSWSDKGHA